MSHVGVLHSLHSSNVLTHAIQVKSLFRNYGSTKILKGLEMNLPVGNIYGLLGPSGCGKTTFLKILLGRLSPGSGIVRVFGHAPGSVGHPVPGSAVGYMPQEAALYPEFTIGETLEFYARLHGMTSEHFQSRKKFLIEFLGLPEEDRLVKNLSGGQNRRVSLCVALLHNPKLLILDEPTVGVDPLLRAKFYGRIWDYLVEIAQTGVSVIITTHYIEEARLANTVGLMRDGKMLAEGDPMSLMQTYSCENLEAVFLKLCTLSGSTDDLATEIETEKEMAGGSSQNNATVDGYKPLPASDDVPAAEPEYVDTESDRCCGGAPRMLILMALLWRNFKRIARSPSFLVFTWLLPALQVMLYCIAIGQDPSNLPFSVVNMDVGISIPSNFSTQNTVLLSSLYLNHLDSSALNWNMESNLHDAVTKIQNGKSWGVAYFYPEFSKSLFERLIANATISNLNSSSIFLQLDMTNQQISLLIRSKVQSAWTQFTDGLVPVLSPLDPNVDPYIADIPLTMVVPPIYGSANPKFTDFIAPGMIVNIAFASSIGLTALAFVVDKREGTMDRTWSSGVRAGEVLLGHIIIQFFVLLIQVSLLLFCALYIFSLPMVGSLVTVFSLTMILGMAGMLYGLWISSICEDEQQAISLSLGSFFPVLLLSGVIWPVQAMPTAMYYISIILPTTWAANGMRDIGDRGWGFDNKDVYTCFAVVSGWVLLFAWAAVRGLKSRD